MKYRTHLHSFLSQFDSLTADEITAIASQLKVQSFPKGTLLTQAGHVSKDCYFILAGCLRQYQIHEGVEKTIEFFTEQQAVTLFSSYVNDTVSDNFLACVEDVVLIVGRIEKETAMYAQFPKLADITRVMMSQQLGQVQDNSAAFLAQTPQERYVSLLKNRPDLLQRVPQYQLASYLGVTPESLSRIKKRLVKQELLH
jgi:CRP-like cAMP-binding protein